MGENTVSIERQTLVDLIYALLLWRGKNTHAKDVRISVYPCARPGETFTSLYRANIMYIDR